MQFVEKTGRTIDDAVAAALKEMGLTREEVTVEVLEKTKSGFLGLGGTLSKVRVTKLEPLPPLSLFTAMSAREEAPVVETPPASKPKPKPESKPESKPEHKPEPKTISKPETKPEPKELKAEPKPVVKPENKPLPVGSSGSFQARSVGNETVRPQPAPAAPRRAESQGSTGQQGSRRRSRGHGEPHPKQARANVSAAPSRSREPRKPLPPATPESAELARFFIDGLLQQMQVDATAAVAMTPEGGLFVDIRGKDLGSLIGRRGDTLDAVQYLTSFVVARQQEGPVRVVVDAENYRARREEALTKLAQRTAEKAIRYRRSQALEPMNAYERHVIHVALQDYPGVSTHSVGNEPARRVVVQAVKSES